MNVAIDDEETLEYIVIPHEIASCPRPNHTLTLRQTALKESSSVLYKRYEQYARCVMYCDSLK